MSWAAGRLVGLMEFLKMVASDLGAETAVDTP
jgi:hypothetical protein